MIGCRSLSTSASALATYLRRGRPAQRAGPGRVRPGAGAASGDELGRGEPRRRAAAAERAGLGAVQAHRLRHTAATELLRAGASLPEVGQVLRHRQAAQHRDLREGRRATRSGSSPAPGRRSGS